MTSTALRPLDFSAAYLDDPTEIHLSLLARLRAWIRLHVRSAVVLAVIVPVVGLLHGSGMYSSPGIKINDDEGTYVSQAWAVQTWHELAHYTYWYDHPPLGWIQITAWAWLTDAWDRAPYAVAVGREFMLVVGLVAAVLVYALARRLSLSRPAAASAVLLFAASPLALHYHRMVFLDNIGTLWLLAALVFAASGRRSLAASAGSAFCLTVAVLSKETTLILAPAVLYLLWQHSDDRTRHYRLTAFITLTGALTSFYPLYALVKSELFEGPGHVSLWGAIAWQLNDRDSNGSIFDNGSGAAGYFHSWLDLDPWLLGLGTALVLPALAIRRLRPLAIGMLIQLVFLLRDGYLPQAYIVAMLPFAALLIAGCADAVVRLPAQKWFRGRRWFAAAAAPPLLAGATMLGLAWAPGVTAQVGRNTDTVQMQQAVSWVRANVPQGSHIITDDNVWLDLVRAGYDPRPPHFSVVWFWKVGTDPAVKLPPGVGVADYFVYAMDPIWAANDAPQIVPAYRQSKVVATFGSGVNQITVRKVER